MTVESQGLRSTQLVFSMFSNEENLILTIKLVLKQDNLGNISHGYRGSFGWQKSKPIIMRMVSAYKNNGAVFCVRKSVTPSVAITNKIVTEYSKAIRLAYDDDIRKKKVIPEWLYDAVIVLQNYAEDIQSGKIKTTLNYV